MIDVEFKIPLLPPSVNHIYKINYRTKSMYMDKTARSFKNTAIFYVPHIDLIDNVILKMEVEYHGKFMNNDGTVKRKDGQNLDKCLYDVIFDKLGVDDKLVWDGSFKKIHDTEEFTLVRLSEIENPSSYDFTTERE